MKPLWMVLIGAIMAAGIGYGVYYATGMARVRAELTGTRPELEWLHQKYHVGEEQFAKIQSLEAEFEPRCRQLYLELSQADAEAVRLIANGTSVTPDISAALQKCGRIHETCQRETLQHVYDVAALMPAQDSKLYIQSMLPRILEPGIQPRRATYSAKTK